MNKAMEAVLKPCPLCGCDDIGTEATVTDGSVWCRGCRLRITKKNWPRDDRGQADAIAAWNRRAPAILPEADEVQRYIERCREMSHGGEFSWWGRLADLITAQAAELAELREQVKAKDEALEPFAAIADDFDADGRDMPDDCPIYANKAGDFRAARAALSEGEAKR